MWNVDVETSDFIIRSDPRQEINDAVYEQIEEKISELINNAVTYALSRSLKDTIKLNTNRDNNLNKESEWARETREAKAR